jgi:hypothetical protein
MYHKCIIPYLYEAQHVSGDTAHHQEPKTALAASGFPSTYEKPEAVSAVLDS